MNTGDTFFGIDEKGHLWVILSDVANDGSVAIANFTTHDPERRPTCDDTCVVVTPAEHSYPTHDSCIFEQGTLPANLRLIRERVATGKYEEHDPLSAPLLERIQQGALDSPHTPEPIKTAIQRSLPQW